MIGSLQTYILGRYNITYRYNNTGNIYIIHISQRCHLIRLIVRVMTHRKKLRIYVPRL